MTALKIFVPKAPWSAAAGRRFPALLRVEMPIFSRTVIAARGPKAASSRRAPNDILSFPFVFIDILGSFVKKQLSPVSSQLSANIDSFLSLLPPRAGTLPAGFVRSFCFSTP